MSATPCKICGSSTRILPDAQFGIDYHHCLSCEYIFKDESALISGTEQRNVYLQHENTPDNAGYVQMFREFIDVISPLSDQTKTALDFGCGPGPVLASLLRDEGIQTRTYDPFFAQNPDVFSGQYDLITATEVLEHLVRPMHELRKLTGMLNPGGILAVMTLFHPGDPALFQNWWYRRDPTHVGFFTPATLMKIADLLGIDLIKQDDRRIAVFQNPSIFKQTGHAKMETVAE